MHAKKGGKSKKSKKTGKKSSSKNTPTARETLIELSRPKTPPKGPTRASQKAPKVPLGGIELAGEERCLEDQQAKERGGDYWTVYLQYGKEVAKDCFGSKNAPGGKVR